MNPTDPIQNDEHQIPVSPAPILGNKTMADRFSTKAMLPRLIIGGIVINAVPNMVAYLYQPFASYAITVRDWANVIFIIIFLITLFFQLKGSNNAKNRP